MEYAENKRLEIKAKKLKKKKNKITKASRKKNRG